LTTHHTLHSSILYNLLFHWAATHHYSVPESRTSANSRLRCLILRLQMRTVYVEIFASTGQKIKAS